MSQLADLCVLITRPSAQSEPLRALISAEGGQAIVLPTIEIMPVKQDVTLSYVKQQDLAIFVSPNAVIMLDQNVKAQWPNSLQIVAVGAGTAAALKLAGLHVQHQPKQFNSEALLKLPILQKVSEKRIVIFKGEGGRDLLATTLKERGALITEKVIYRRVLPKIDLKSALPDQLRKQINIIVCTSNTGLQNLVELISTANHKWLLNMPLLVISQRMANFACELGFVRMPLVAENATDEAIVKALLSFAKSKVNKN